jgi:hypothetical protein
VIFGRDRLRWDGPALRLNRKSKALARIEPDSQYPSMWRVQLPDGELSSMVNQTRARDAAMAYVLALLNGRAKSQETRAEGSPVRSSAPADPKRRKAA